ncbi:MAG: hypothetical protein AAEI08_05140 [Gammaproteobacteria bacterium]
MRISKAYWIWGQFDEYSTKELTKLKSQVDHFLQGPFFDVHLTLSGPMKNIDKSIVDLFYGLKEQINKIEIQCVNYGCKEKYYESLFIEIFKSKTLLKLKKILDDTFKLESKYFFPHVSLFYGEEHESKKSFITSKLPKISKQLYLNKISLVEVDEQIELWKIIHQVKMA